MLKEKESLPSYHNTIEIPTPVNILIIPISKPLLNANFFPISYDFNRLS